MIKAFQELKNWLRNRLLDPADFKVTITAKTPDPYFRLSLVLAQELIDLRHGNPTPNPGIMTLCDMELEIVPPTELQIQGSINHLLVRWTRLHDEHPQLTLIYAYNTISAAQAHQKTFQEAADRAHQAYVELYELHKDDPDWLVVEAAFLKEVPWPIGVGQGYSPNEGPATYEVLSISKPV
jgi:hypothetical protein